MDYPKSPAHGELPDWREKTEEQIVQEDTGLGTAFERWALNRMLLRLHRDYHFQSVLEGPGDGMTGISGINSLVFGCAGLPASVLLKSRKRSAFARRLWEKYSPGSVVHFVESDGGWEIPYQEHTFDLVWNFNVINRSLDPDALLNEMARVSRRYLLFFVPNRDNYGFPLHRMHHRVSGETWDHGPVELLRPEPWKESLSRLGWAHLETLWVDCPWWPDIVDLGRMVEDFFPPLKRPPLNRLSRRARPENRMRTGGDDLPYYQPECFPEFHRKMEKMAYFENIRWLVVKRRFAHHVGILAIREGSMVR